MWMLWGSIALADYIAPPPDEMIRQATGIVDATVTAYDARGRAVLDVHAVLAGAPTDAIPSVSLACVGGSIEKYGVQAGRRYVFLLRGEQMFEEQTYFDVRGDDVRFWANADGERAWMSRDAARARIAAVRAAK